MVFALRSLSGGGVRRALSPALAAAGFLVCLSAALTHRHILPGLWGFLPQIGPFWYVGLALIIGALIVARSGSERCLAFAAVLLILALTGTPALVYDGPRSQSASKHMEFVEQIRTMHHINSTVTLYRDWPGFFSAVAWMCDVAGVRSLMPIATAWPALIAVVRVVAMQFLARGVLRTPAQVWTAVTLGFLADPIGVDYFSPQSLGFVLGLLAFGVAVSGFGIRSKVILLLTLGCSLTVSHQLSPYAVGGTLAVLVAFRRLRPWWLPFTVLGPAVGWALLHWADLDGFISLGSMGDARNFRPPHTDAAPGLARDPIVTMTVLALVLGILLLAAVAASALLRNRTSTLDWSMACCPAVGLIIVTVNPYGYEGIFRAALFGVPWLALLASRLLERPPPWFGRAGRTALTAALCGTYLTASFGLDGSNVLRPADRAAFQHFKAQPIPPGRVSRLLLIGPGDLPSSPPTQDRSHLSVKPPDIDAIAPGEPDESPQHAVTRMTQVLLKLDGGNPINAPLYAIWSPASAFYAQEYGLDTPQRFGALREAFRSDPRWTVIFASSGTVLFRYRGSLPADPPR